MGKLKDIDKKASDKGSGIETVWQFVKFIVVSLLAMIVQFASLNILLLLPQIKEIISDPYEFWVFASDLKKTDSDILSRLILRISSHR